MRNAGRQTLTGCISEAVDIRRVAADALIIILLPGFYFRRYLFGIIERERHARMETELAVCDSLGNLAKLKSLNVPGK